MAFLDHKKYYFMAGLPRSGSTLLSSILNQNPRFFATPSSPMPAVMMAAIGGYNNNELFHAYPRNQEAATSVRRLYEAYYENDSAEVIIDKNRSWTNNLDLVRTYISTEPKIICPVRNFDEILASFLALIKRNPFKDGQQTKINFVDEYLVGNKIPITDENRCMHLISNDGIVGASYNGLKAVYEKEETRKFLYFVEYDQLVKNPMLTLEGIYNFLDEPMYEHTFDDIRNLHQENDLGNYGLADMHEVRPTLSRRVIDPKEIVPEGILKSVQNGEFWRA